MSSYRAAKSGIAADTQAKIRSKYDPELASQCMHWINEILKEGGDSMRVNTDGSDESVSSQLRDGLILCKVMNVLTPGSIPAGKLTKAQTLPFKQMELIGLFVTKIKEYGIPDYDCFQTVDLHEAQNMHQVILTLQTLGRKAGTHGHYGFGPKESEANVRHFTEEQLKSGQNVIGLQMGSNKGASQAGMTFGKARMIND
ncbi:hypothetical protein ScPMuIL_012981 [Solemya velum]